MSCVLCVSGAGDPLPFGVEQVPSGTIPVQHQLTFDPAAPDRQVIIEEDLAPDEAVKARVPLDPQDYRCMPSNGSP